MSPGPVPSVTVCVCVYVRKVKISYVGRNHLQASVSHLIRERHVGVRVLAVCRLV